VPTVQNNKLSSKVPTCFIYVVVAVLSSSAYWLSNDEILCETGIEFLHHWI